MNCPLQEEFYQQHKDRRVMVYLQSGVRITGILLESSPNCLTITDQTCKVLIMKHTVTSVITTS